MSSEILGPIIGTFLPFLGKSDCQFLDTVISPHKIGGPYPQNEGSLTIASS